VRQSVVNPGSVPPRLDDAGGPQDAEVPRDGRLRDTERLLEVTNAKLSVGKQSYDP